MGLGLPALGLGVQKIALRASAMFAAACQAPAKPLPGGLRLVRISGVICSLSTTSVHFRYNLIPVAEEVSRYLYQPTMNTYPDHKVKLSFFAPGST